MAFSEDEVEGPNLEEERHEFLDDVDLDEEFGRLAPADAVAKLEPLLGEHPNNGHLHYLLGRANADNGDIATAMTHYHQAVEVDPRYADDSRIISDAKRAFSDKKDETAEPAKPLLTTLLGSSAAQRAEDAVFEIAIDSSWGTRRRARDLLKSSGRWEAMPEWKRHAVDLGLVGKSACQQGLKHVKALAESGEPGALPALEKASRRPKEGCGFLKKSDCYKCMRGEISSAIRKLEEAGESAPTPARPDAGQ